MCERSLVILSLFFVLLVGSFAQGCPAAAIAHSNVTPSSPCAAGPLGTPCPFSCDAGFVDVGAHVCQSYTTASGVAVLNNTFFGGRCDALCAGEAPCAPGDVPVRRNVSAADGGWCLSTLCTSEDDALRRLARGNYGLWRLGRDARTGMYSDSVDATAAADAQSDIAHIGINGVALMLECVAAEMGWISRDEAASRVNASLTALAGELPGFSLVRQAAAGWIPTFFNRSSGGHVYAAQPYTVLDSGLNSAGVLFAREYFVGTAGRDNSTAARALTASIARLGRKVYNLVRFENGILCNDAGRVDAAGFNIPFTLDDTGGCGALHAPEADGFYGYSELHYTVWLAYSRVCAGYPPGGCPDKAIESMWTAWQGRRLHPNFAYKSFPLLSDWSAYIVHLPFYSSGSFNTDKNWSALFASHWAADKAYFQSSAYDAGSGGRYGLGAGPTDVWCSAKDAAYEADMLAGEHYSAGAQGCKMVSPYAVAGYMPAAPAEVTADLLALLAAGDALVAVDSFVRGDFALLRKSLIEPSFSQATRITMVDFCSELLGLSTKWLGVDFFKRYTTHNFTDLAG